MPRVRSFEELTPNKQWAEEIRRVYHNDIDKVAPAGGLDEAVEHTVKALLECGPRVQTAQRIVAALDDTNSLARENFRQARFPIAEWPAQVLAEQREHTYRPAAGGA